MIYISNIYKIKLRNVNVNNVEYINNSCVNAV